MNDHCSEVVVVVEVAQVVAGSQVPQDPWAGILHDRVVQEMGAQVDHYQGHWEGILHAQGNQVVRDVDILMIHFLVVCAYLGG